MRSDRYFTDGVNMLTKVECILCENIFGRYCIPISSKHRPAPAETLRGDVWEMETIQFMREHVRDRDIVHAGMYFGDFLPGLASAMAPGRTIYGFEPHAENFACAQWTVVLNGLSNVRLSNFGLGSGAQQGFMRTTTQEGVAMGGGSRVVADDDPGKALRDDPGVRPVILGALDEMLPPSADVGIIQLDVEGYEGFALLGALKTIRRCRPIIIVETLPVAVVKNHLHPLGYVQTQTVCGNTILMASSH